MRSTVLIAPHHAIPALRQQPSLHEAVSFADTDVERALARIRQQPPGLLAIERDFAASLSGQALIREIRSNPELSDCEIQTVGLRRSTRHRIVEPVMLDGAPATLLDISITGAHVACASSLRPRQQVQIALRAATPPLTAHVVWVQYELPAEGPRYRAGVEFVSSAATAVAAFISEMTR